MTNSFISINNTANIPSTKENHPLIENRFSIAHNAMITSLLSTKKSYTSIIPPPLQYKNSPPPPLKNMTPQPPEISFQHLQ